MARPRVLVTGPVESLDEWCAAAERAGWEALPFALIEIEELAPAPDEARALLAQFLAAPLATPLAESTSEPAANPLAVPPAERLCVTSVHALPFLAALAAREPRLCALPCSVVGQKSVGRLRALGFSGTIDWHASAEALRSELLALEPRPARVLWPRGDKSDEFARVLRDAGVQVRDPLAYRNRPRAGATPPQGDLVFFASPSAVRAWSELGAPGPARALVIGATTFQALLGEKRLAFSDIIALSEPTSSAFAAALQHIDLRSTP